MTSITAQESITISGTLKDEKTGEAMLFTKVSVPELQTGVVTNEYGYFSLQVPKGDSVTLKILSVDHPPYEMKIAASEDVIVEIEVPTFTEMKPVQVKAKKSEGEENVTNTEVSVVRLDIKEAKNLPALGGGDRCH